MTDDVTSDWERLFGNTHVSNSSYDELAAAGSEHSSVLSATQDPFEANTRLRLTAEFLGIPFQESLLDFGASADFVEHVSISFARRHMLIGLATDDEKLVVAASTPQGWNAIGTIGRLLGREIQPWFAPPPEIRKAINSAYEKQSGQAQNLIQSINESASVFDELQQLKPREDLLDTSQRAPVVKLVNMVLFEAVTGLASDVHVQPYEDSVVVRLRIDGILHDAYECPKHLQDEVISRIKVIGRMNIAEKRLPLDGRATVEVGDRLIDLRIATMPTSHGERAVIRLLDKSARQYVLGELGMGEQTLSGFRQLIHQEHGMILVTGPTGSGKSTTLYSALQEINSRERNVVTLEDPIEYQLDGVSQTQINIRKGMTFASGLRSVLRQDPDIIMIGEIRDEETAVMAIQSALTGHLVFSTLHTNDAASAVTRLLDLGIEPYLVASSLLGVLAQRLVRLNCSSCVRPYAPQPEELRQFGLTELDTGELAKGLGCKNCRNTGFVGRFSITELLMIDEAIRERIQTRANASDILQSAVQAGMSQMRDDGLHHVLKHRTTLAEVARVTVNAII